MTSLEMQQEEVAALEQTFGEDFYLEKPVWGLASFTILVSALPQISVECHFTYSKTYPKSLPQIEIRAPRKPRSNSNANAAVNTLPPAEFANLKRVLTAEAERLVKDGVDGPFIFQLVELARDFLYAFAAAKPSKPLQSRMEVDLRKDRKLFPPPPPPPLLRSMSDSNTNTSLLSNPTSPKPFDQKLEDPRIARSGGRYLLDFEELDRLGKGGFGVVVKARNRLDGMIYAVKQIRLPKNNDEALRKTRNEVTTLARVIHPNIVRYFMSWLEDCDARGEEEEEGEEEDESGFEQSLLRPPSAFSATAEGFDTELSKSSSFYSSSSSSSSSSSGEEEEDEDEESSNSEESAPAKGGFLTLFIVMEYVPRTLRSMIDKGELFGKEDLCFAIIREVLEALACIHDMLVVHHDIKPDNLLVDQAGRVKLGDFGLAAIRNKNKESDEEVGGTALYRAPEIAEGRHWDEKCDIFSLGVVVVEMFCRPMQTTMERMKVLGALKDRPIVLPPHLPDTVVALATLLLQRDPKKRPSASQAYAKAIPGHVLSSQVDSVIKSKLLPSSIPYQRLLKYFFSQLPSPELNEAYDVKSIVAAEAAGSTGHGAHEHKNRGHSLRIFSELSTANVLPPLECVVPAERELTMQMMEQVCKSVFQRLGFSAFHVPFLVPSSPSSSSSALDFGKKKRVTLLDQAGLVVELPHLSLTRNFARFVSQHRTEINFMRRFDVGHTFWLNAQGGQPASERQFCADLVCPACDMDGDGTGAASHALLLEMAQAVREVLKQEDWQGLGEMHLEIGHAQFLPRLLELAKVPPAVRLPLVHLVKERHQFKDWKECQHCLQQVGVPLHCIQTLRFCLPIANENKNRFSASTAKEWEDWSTTTGAGAGWETDLAKQVSPQILQECGLGEMLDFASFLTRLGQPFRLVAWIASVPPDTTGLYFRCIMRARRAKHAHSSGSGSGGGGAGGGSSSSSKRHIEFEFGHEFVAADGGRFDGLLRNTGLIGVGTRLYMERVAKLRMALPSTERFMMRPLVRVCAPMEKDGGKFEDEERCRVAARLRQDLPHNVGVEWIHPKGLSFEALFSLAREQGARIMISKPPHNPAIVMDEYRVRAVSFSTELHTLGNFTDKRVQSWEELLKTVAQLVKI